MGLLKNAIKNGISNAVDKAVTAGVQNIVAPAVNKVAEAAANKVAGQINEAGQALNQANEAMAQVNGEVKEAANTVNTELNATGASLGSLFSSYVNNATSFAANIASNFKECPNCGEVSPKGTEFCPKCGTKLPEGALTDDFTCEVCGTINLPETAFCVKCGAKLKATVAAESKLAAKWAELLQMFPMYTNGGTDLELEDGRSYDDPYVLLTGRIANHKPVEAYLATLPEAGFEKVNYNDYRKEVNGIVYRVYADENAEQDELRIAYTALEKKEEKKADPTKKLSDVIDGSSEALEKGVEEAKKAFKAVSGFFKK